MTSSSAELARYRLAAARGAPQAQALLRQYLTQVTQTPGGRIDPSLATPAYLTGESAPTDPLNAAIASLRSESLAQMNAYYRDVWRPARLTQYPGLPPAIATVSAYRSFGGQASIVAGQLRALGIDPNSSDDAVRDALLQILTTRSLPGFSRHHWNTDIDVVTADSRSWETDPALVALADFMHYEAPQFGFYTPYWEGNYPNADRPHYNSEPWHLSYYPLSESLRESWLAEYGSDTGLARLLGKVAGAVGYLSGVPADRLRRVLETLDMASYQNNVVPAPRAEAPTAIAAQAFDANALTATGFTPTNLTFDKMRQMERESAAPFDADVKANVADPVFRAAWDAWYERAWRPFFDRYAGSSAPFLPRLGAVLESDAVARRAERFRTELTDFIDSYGAQQGLPATRAATPILASLSAPALRSAAWPPFPFWAGIVGGALGTAALAWYFRRRSHKRNKSGPVRRIAR